MFDKTLPSLMELVGLNLIIFELDVEQII